MPYIRDILRGKSKPRLVSWAVWALLLTLTALVSWQNHQTSSAIFSGVSAIACAAVALLAVRYASFELTRLEKYLLLGSVIGICLWLTFNNPMLVLITALTIDGIAYLPTYINGWHNPHHESMSMYAISAFGSALVLLAAVLARATSSGLIYPIYSFAFGFIMVAILLTRRQSML